LHKRLRCLWQGHAHPYYRDVSTRPENKIATNTIGAKQNGQKDIPGHKTIAYKKKIENDGT